MQGGKAAAAGKSGEELETTGKLARFEEAQLHRLKAFYLFVRIDATKAF